MRHLILLLALIALAPLGCQKKPPAPQVEPAIQPVQPLETLGRPEEVKPLPPVVENMPPAVTEGKRAYTVVKGDGLMAIARKELGDASRWKEIQALNPEIKDPNKLKVGQVLVLPPK